jgi:hypothetical protein
MSRPVSHPVIARDDCKVTSMDKWRQGARAADWHREISGVLRGMDEMARIPCIYKGFSVSRLLASTPERGNSAIPARSLLMA